MRYQLQKNQQLSCDIETAWEFFSAPENLSRITPKEMNFVVKSAIKDVPMYEGMVIDYTVSPLLNIPMKWKTRITQVEDLKSFTDFQEKGPYKYWNHYHEFIPNEKGVLMKDTIDYELPFGFMGRIAHALVVKKKLENIFNYRNKVIDELFNSKNKTV
ncbi:SRPBCC family protein [Xanthomarina sp.]|uniref:SRPBCC family protein n=1 Tax=Xanthomarina sp. TaxID=1931211 RepID=UPI002C650063|nr:SRPBCC family protein [Xanthomarina sp.]HLV40360.1 SRPBCC family protein [Xanthomarina sp.]